MNEGEIDEFFEGTTFGMEYDCGLFDRHRSLDARLGRFCQSEIASHSNAGVGADPSLRLNAFGGEVQVCPAPSESALLARTLSILESQLAEDYMGFPGTIHVHVRVPRLLERPDVVRHLVRWTAIHWQTFARELWRWDYRATSPYNDWLERCNRDVKSLTYDEAALRRMDEAPDDVKEIARALHNWPTNWKGEWVRPTTKVKRPAVNFGHLAINETIEFRCFATTVDPIVLRNIIEFPLRYLRMALKQDPDGLRIIRGVQLQDCYRLPDSPHHDGTSLYFNQWDAARDYLAKRLINKELTLADLNYPQFWIDRGFG